MRVFLVVLVIWLLIGALAAWQRGYYTASSANCAGVGTILVTIAFGPRIQRVERVGAGQRVQVVPEEPHVSSPPGSRASG